VASFPSERTFRQLNAPELLVEVAEADEAKPDHGREEDAA
jgi:hypothetical protein